MAFGDTDILDAFNRSDEGPPAGANWTELGDVSDGFQVVSNVAKNETLSAACAEYYDVETFGPACEVRSTLPLAGGNRSQQVMIRLKDLGANHDGYSFEADGFTNRLKIHRWDNGSGTELGWTSQTITSGDKMGGESDGNDHAIWFDDGGAGWSEISSETDSTYPDAGYLGMRCWTANAAGCTFDDFGGGTLVTGVTVAPAFAAAAGVAIGPSVVLGSTSMAPAFAGAGAAAVGPSVVLGSTSMAPVFAAAGAVAVAPGVVLGAVTVTPVFAGAVAAAVGPTVVLGSTSMAPAFAAAACAAIDPIVLLLLPYTPSPDRTLYVQAEARVLAIPAEARVLAIPAEARVLLVKESD